MTEHGQTIRTYFHREWPNILHTETNRHSINKQSQLWAKKYEDSPDEGKAKLTWKVVRNSAHACWLWSAACSSERISSSTLVMTSQTHNTALQHLQHTYHTFPLQPNYQQKFECKCVCVCLIESMAWAPIKKWISDTLDDSFWLNILERLHQTSISFWVAPQKSVCPIIGRLRFQILTMPLTSLARSPRSWIYHALRVAEQIMLSSECVMAAVQKDAKVVFTCLGGSMCLPHLLELVAVMWRRGELGNGNIWFQSMHATQSY